MSRATIDTALGYLADGKSSRDCPAAKSHTEQPSNYLDAEPWAERMQKTHEQRQCHKCGFWVIWKPKRRPLPKRKAGR